MSSEKSISSFIVKEQALNRTYSSYIRASSIGMCKRRIGYQMMGYQGIPEDGHSLFTLNLGSSIHNMVQMYLVKLGWIKSKITLDEQNNIKWIRTEEDKISGCEIPLIDEKLKIRGHCDGITVPLLKKDGLYYPDKNGKRYLIEIKSITDRSRFWVLGIKNGGENLINEWDFPSEFLSIDYEKNSSGNLVQKLSRFSHVRPVKSRYGTKNYPVYKVKINGKEELITVLQVGNSVGSFASITEPKPEHILQASLYSYMSGIKDILFLYIGKDIDKQYYENEEDILNIPIKIFEYERNETALEIAREKIITIHEAIENNTLPSRDYNWEDNKSPCRWCPFSWQCYPEKIDIERINFQLERINISQLKPGPWGQLPND